MWALVLPAVICGVVICLCTLCIVMSYMDARVERKESMRKGIARITIEPGIAYLRSGRGPVHFGKHVASAAHYQLRQMLAYKCSRTGGRSYIEVDGRDSTMTCSNCGTKSGPVGLSGLAVRQWRCKDCGGLHDRDINAAMNTLRVGVGATPQRGICNDA